MGNRSRRRARRTGIQRAMGGGTFATVFDPKRNSLNFLRLILAVSVIVWHAFPLSGADIGWAPLRQLLSNVPVDAFFAISGFLIFSAWARSPRWRPFLRARVLRIMPAYWVCLLVTAFVFAPAVSGVVSHSNVMYVLSNPFLVVNQSRIEGTLQSVPFPGTWNGSLWTLGWEFLCYLGVLVVGVLGVLRWRSAIAALFTLALVGELVTSIGWVENNYVVLGSRFGLMFLAGAMVWRYRDRLPVSRTLILAAGLIAALSLMLPDYRLVGALPAAYLVLAAGAVIKRPVVRTDVSYGMYIYAFPVQQILAVGGVAELGVAVFAAASVAVTVPLAAASWFLIERPAMALRGRAAAPRGSGLTVVAPSAPPATG